MNDHPEQRAYVRPNLGFGGVRIALQAQPGVVVTWPSGLTLRRVDDFGVEHDDEWLPMGEGLARALYEALADYFGHGTNDVRALRKDYDAERARVDKLTDHMLFQLGRNLG